MALYSWDFFDYSWSHLDASLNTGVLNITTWQTDLYQTYSGFSTVMALIQTQGWTTEYEAIIPTYNLGPIYQQLFEIKLIILTLLLLYAFMASRKIRRQFIFWTKWWWE